LLTRFLGDFEAVDDGQGIRPPTSVTPPVTEADLTSEQERRSR
jgi:hypothetical protein